MGPLELLPLEEPGRLDRALGRRPARNAWVELHNLIAAAGSAREFGPEALQRIGRRYGVDLYTAFFEERLGLYAALLDDALHGGALTGAERRALAHVALTLGLDPEDLAPVHDRAFGRVVGEVLADDCLSVEERLLLYTMQHTLAIGRRAETDYARAARERLVRAVAHALCDGALSPDEDEHLRAQAAALDTTLPDEVQPMLARARRIWSLRRAELEPLRIALPVKAQRGERCYFKGPVAWRAFNARVELRDGRWSVHPDDRGHASKRVAQAHRARTRDVGTVYLTNRRVLLEPPSGHTVRLALRHVAAVQQVRSGVLLLRDGTRQYALHPREDAERFGVLIQRLVHAP